VRAAAVAADPRRNRRAARAARRDGRCAPLVAAGAGVAIEAVAVESVEGANGVAVEGGKGVAVEGGKGVAVEGVAVYAHVVVGVPLGGAAPLGRQAAAGRLRRESRGAARAARVPLE